ncbi:MAG TPA: DUF58 domain-containing protein [Phycisphaerae bacterium]|nr:DUF58 domain-containing protein [Phycisphaerae bacterium]
MSGMSKNHPPATESRRTYFEVTFVGFVFVCVTLFVLIAAINSQTNILFWALGVVVGGWIFAAVVSKLLLKKLEVTRSVPDHNVAGQPSEVLYKLRNGKRFWPSCAVRITEARHTGDLKVVPDAFCLYVAPDEQTLIMSHLVARRRGVLELRELRVCCSFPFGFMNRAIHFIQPQRIIVFPRIGTLSRELMTRSRTFSPSGTVSTLNRGGTDDFFGLRDYTPGDSIRAIHWRRSARTGDLVVKEMTSNSPPSIVIAVDLRHWRDITDGPAVCERAIELAATWICRGLLDHFSVGLIVPGSSSEIPNVVSSGKTQRQILLEALALLDLRGISSHSTGSHTNSPSERQNHKAEYIVIALTEELVNLDMVPVGCAYTLLTMDDKDSDRWVYFPNKESPKVDNLVPATENSKTAPTA